ncbi:MAG: hypothetical protein SAJ37_00070 [Oscillatoria sp. PMC 1068.18]|nr:hypothetical protein [Oscillatoria sp. PMC 1076.18]MEC4987115.1 hypothetical protein [Oscillatoria sp. PMC 1068.18]
MSVLARQLNNFCQNFSARDRGIRRSQVKVRLDTQRLTFCRAECGLNFVQVPIVECASSEVKLSRNLKQISKVTENLQKLSSEKLATVKKDQLTQLQEVLKRKLPVIEKIIEGDEYL